MCRNVHVGDIAGYLNNDGYIEIKINNILYKAHRLAWLYITGNWPIYEVDHVEGVNIPNFNKFSNLRDVQHIKNMWNIQGLIKTNTTGFRGVCFNKYRNKYYAQIKVNNKVKWLGYFNTPEEASVAYEEAKLKYHII
jgi:hypothetical protein